MEILIAYSIICGGAAAAIAASKDRNPLGWFFGGLLLGLIGIFMVGFMPALKGGQS